MAKKKDDPGLPVPMEMPMIKKIVDCPKCGAKMEVEFEIELDPVMIPALMGTPTEEGADDKD